VTGGIAIGAGHTSASASAGHAIVGGFGCGADAHAARNRTHAMTDNPIRGLGLPRDCCGIGDRHRDRLVDISETAEEE
jgi:uncharacterized protein YjlB